MGSMFQKEEGAYLGRCKTLGWLNSLSRVQLFATLRTAACQAPLSMEFSKKEYWSGLPFPSTGDLPIPGNKIVGYLPLAPPRKPPILVCCCSVANSCLTF